MSMQNMISRCTVVLVNAARKLQTLQARILAGEVKDGVEHMEPYGFTSHPHEGAEGVALFPGGDRSHAVVLVVADRRYRLQGLKAGEAALYDDQGQCVHLTRKGIVVKAAGMPVTITDAEKLLVECPIECTHDITDQVGKGGKSMASMRSTYNGHNHPDAHGGNTDKPNQQA
jgi:phage baseplate assembly protein V